MNEIFEKTSWLDVVEEKLAESSALRESERVVADRRRLAIIVWMSNTIICEFDRVRQPMYLGTYSYLTVLKIG